MTRIEMAEGWEEKILADWDVFADTRLGPEIVVDAKRFAPVGPSWGYDPKHPRTPPHQGGELRESIGHRRVGHTLIIEATAPYSADVEMGTLPHIIRSKVFGTNPGIWRSHALGERQLWSLWSPVSGEYFGPIVHHPGTRPQSFLRAAVYQRRGE